MSVPTEVLRQIWFPRYSIMCCFFWIHADVGMHLVHGPLLKSSSNCFALSSPQRSVISSFRANITGGGVNVGPHPQQLPPPPLPPHPIWHTQSKLQSTLAVVPQGCCLKGCCLRCACPIGCGGNGGHGGGRISNKVVTLCYSVPILEAMPQATDTHQIPRGWLRQLRLDLLSFGTLRFRILVECF